MTCSELLVTGTPAVLVPAPDVAEDHQTHNALAMEATGAARVLRERNLTGESLAETVREMLVSADDTNAFNLKPSPRLAYYSRHNRRTVCL